MAGVDHRDDLFSPNRLAVKAAVENCMNYQTGA
jgi:hypothetical protein